MDELVRKHSTIMDKYDPAKKVAMIVDEWGTWFAVEPGTHPRFLYQQNTLRDAVVAAVSLEMADIKLKLTQKSDATTFRPYCEARRTYAPSSVVQPKSMEFARVSANTSSRNATPCGSFSSIKRQGALTATA